VNSARTAEHIGDPKGKCGNDDPYGAGEESEKCTKPNAVSAAANDRVHAKAAEHPPPASLPTHMPSPSPEPHSPHTQLPSTAPGPASYAQLHVPTNALPHTTYICVPIPYFTAHTILLPHLLALHISPSCLDNLFPFKIFVFVM
jgi:hypothetical protein